MAVYDTEKAPAEDGEKQIPHSLNDVTGIHPDEEQAMDDAAHSGAADDIAEREGLFNPGGDSPSGDSSPASKDKLKSKEEGEDGDEGGSGWFARRAREKANKDQERIRAESAKKEERFKSTMGGSSALKKKVAIAAAAAGGSVALGAIAFFALLPLKIEGLLDNLDTRFTASSEAAVDNEVENMYSEYVAKSVLPGILTKGECHQTADISCVGSDAGPIGRMYKAWSQGKLENKLATNDGILIGRRGNSYYMNVGGQTLSESDLKDVASGKNSLFDLPDTKPATRNEIRTAVKNGLKDETYFNRVYLRFKFGKLLEEKYGITRCLIACDTQDKFASKISDKKAAGKAFIVRRVVTPYSQSTGLLLECLIAGSCESDTSNASLTGDPDDPEKSSNFEQGLDKRLRAYAESEGNDKLADLVAKANGISKDGFTRYMFKQATGDAVGTQLTEDAGEDEAEDDNPVGIVNMIAQIVKVINTIGPAVKKINYAIGTAAAVQMYMTFRTAADEVHNGHIDTTEIGSVTAQLDNDNVDASSTPLYAEYNGGTDNPTTGSIFSTASADSTTNTSDSAGVYKCANGKTVPPPTAKNSTYPVCSEEDFAGGNQVTTDITASAQKIPGWSVLSSVAGVVNALGSIANKILGPLLKVIPGFGTLAGYLNQAIQPLFKLITGVLIISPLKDATDGITPSGGRTYDLVAAGDDVSQNKACETQLGCPAASPALTAYYSNQAMQQQKQAFDQQSMFARMFDTNSSYSMVSHLANDLPDTLVSGTNSLFASLVSDPFGKLSSAFGSLFSANHAFALDTSDKDPFGIQQYAYTPAELQSLDSQVAADGGYSNYWQQNCSGDYMTAWENSQQLDPNTGDAVVPKGDTNYCMLINTAVQSAGGLFDSTLLSSTGSSQ